MSKGRSSTPAARARDEAARASRPPLRTRLLRGSGVRRGALVGTSVGLVVGLIGGFAGGVAAGGGPLGAGVGAAHAEGGADDAAADPGIAEATEPVRPARQITLSFAGDIHFENHLAVLAEDPDSLSELQGSLGSADVAIANVETALTERGAPIPGKPFTWRAPERALAAVAGAGVDVVAMANNHAVDYGSVGLEDTLAAAESSPVPVIGIGADDDEAFAPWITTVRGVEVAYLNASQIVEETLLYNSAGPDTPGIASAVPLDRLLRGVRQAREEADVVVVYMHMGAEGYTCPGDAAIATAEALEEAGADVIVGDHAHRVNGAGWVGDAYVHYGLGNFVYYMSTEPAAHTGVLTVTVDVPASDEPRPDRPLVTEADWDAMLIEGDGIPRRQDAATTERLQTAFETARECTPARATP